MGISLNLMMMMILVVMSSVFIPIYCSLPPCKMKEVRTYNWRDPQQMPSGSDDHILHGGCQYSSPPPTLHRLDVGIQWEIREAAEPMKSGYQDEDEYEYESEVENNYAGHGSSPSWMTQFNKVDEGIQCDMRYAASVGTRKNMIMKVRKRTVTVRDRVPPLPGWPRSTKSMRASGAT